MPLQRPMRGRPARPAKGMPNEVIERLITSHRCVLRTWPVLSWTAHAGAVTWWPSTRSSTGRAASMEVGSFLAQRGYRRAWLIADERTSAPQDPRLRKAAAPRACDVKKTILPGEPCPMPTGTPSAARLRPGASGASLIAVGSGTITDLARFLAYRTGTFFVRSPRRPAWTATRLRSRPWWWTGCASPTLPPRPGPSSPTPTFTAARPGSSSPRGTPRCWEVDRSGRLAPLVGLERRVPLPAGRRAGDRCGSADAGRSQLAGRR